jgi:hypothetical protein
VASRNTLLFDEAEDLFVDRSASLERHLVSSSIVLSN